MRDALLSGPGAAEMEAFFTLAIETGMRLGELFSITVGQIRSEGGVWVARLTDTKNGLGRKVTLSTRAIAAVQTLRSTRTKDQKLVAITPGALRYRWDRARRISGVKGLHFHDLRHEGLSLMAQAGLDIGQLQAQSGHKTPGILLTYVNARPSEVAKKLG
jgi:integrase